MGQFIAYSAVIDAGLGPFALATGKPRVGLARCNGIDCRGLHFRVGLPRAGAAAVAVAVAPSVWHCVSRCHCCMAFSCPGYHCYRFGMACEYPGIYGPSVCQVEASEAGGPACSTAMGFR